MADLTLVIQAVEKNTASIARVADALEKSSRRMEKSFGKLSEAQRNAGTQLTTFSDKVRRVAIGALERLGAGLLGLAQRGFSALMDAVVGSVKTFVGFEAAIAEVSTLVDSSVTSNEELAASVKSMAAQYGGGIKGQAKALYSVISAGAKQGAEATKVLTTANQLAIGGVTDVQTAAKGLTAVMNAFGLNMEAFSDIVSQKFFTAMRMGQTTIDELARSMGTVAPMAAAAGISLDELFASVSTVTTGGISTAEAVTAVNQALISIFDPTKKATDEAARLGIEFDALALRKKGLVGVIKDVMSAQDLQNDSTAKLFGNVRALKAVLALAGDDAAKYAETFDAVKNNTDDAVVSTEKMTETTAQMMNNLKSAGEIASEAFGNMISGSDGSKEAIKGLTGVTLSLARAFDRINELGILDKMLTQMVEISRFLPGAGSAVAAIADAFGRMGDRQATLEAVRIETDKLKAALQKNNDELLRSIEFRGLEAQSTKQLAGAQTELIDKLIKQGVVGEDLKETIQTVSRISRERLNTELRGQKELAEAERRAAAAAKQAAAEAAKAKALEDEEDRIKEFHEWKEKAVERHEEAIKKAREQVLEERGKTEMEILKGQGETELRLQRELEKQKEELAETSARRMAEIGRIVGNLTSDIFGAMFRSSKSFMEKIEDIFLALAKRLLASGIASLVTGLFTGGVGGLPLIGGLFADSGGVVGGEGLNRFQKKKVVKMQSGGVLQGGISGRDSIPVIAQQGEEFLTRQDRKIVHRALESGGGAKEVNVNLSLNVSGSAPNRADTYRFVVEDLGPALMDAIKTGQINLQEA